MSKSWKYGRSRKPWDIDTLQLKLQDAMASMEVVFLGEEGEDYDKEEIQFLAKTSHAYSQLGGKIRQAIKAKKIEEMEEEIEELKQKMAEQ